MVEINQKRIADILHAHDSVTYFCKKCQTKFTFTPEQLKKAGKELICIFDKSDLELYKEPLDTRKSILEQMQKQKIEVKVEETPIKQILFFFKDNDPLSTVVSNTLLAQLEKKKDIDIIPMDIAYSKEEVDKYAIRKVPTLLFVKNDSVLETLTYSMISSNSIKSAIENLSK